MSKSFQCAILIASMLSVSLFGGKNIGLTKEIENQRECVVCSVKKTDTKKTTENVEEVAEEGPTLGYTEGFWVEEKETVYLLETYGCRVLEITKKSTREILLPDAVLPSDIMTHGEYLYIFDDILSELQIYTKQGEPVQRSKIGLEDDYVKGLVKTEEGVAVLTYGNQRIAVSPETGEQTVLEPMEVPVIDAAGYDATEYISTDKDGTVFAVHTNLIEKCSVISGELTLRAVSAEGALVGIYVLPMEEYTYLPRQYVQVQENGNVYLMVPTEQSVEVRKVALKDTMDSCFSAISEATKTIEIDYSADVRYRKKVGTACKEVTSFSREEVRERAQAMAEYEWKLKKIHTEIDRSGCDITLPREIAAIQKANEGKSSWSVMVTGIPYCWGGYYALDVGLGGKNFQSRMDRKYLAGNIKPSGYYKYLTAGVDCSGYVSAALGFKEKQGTGGLATIGSKISNVDKLQQMDILVYPGDHVIFFREWLNDSTMLVSEATVRDGKVVTHPKSLNQLVTNGRYQMRSPW